RLGRLVELGVSQRLGLAVPAKLGAGEVLRATVGRLPVPVHRFDGGDPLGRGGQAVTAPSNLSTAGEKRVVGGGAHQIEAMLGAAGFAAAGSVHRAATDAGRNLDAGGRLHHNQPRLAGDASGASESGRSARARCSYWAWRACARSSSGRSGRPPRPPRAGGSRARSCRSAT